MARGYVYVLFNASLRQNQFKIGLTTGSPEDRARELSRATGVPQPYEVAYSVQVEDCAVVERLVHQRLDKHRIGKEFFELRLATAIRVIEEAASQVGRIETTEIDAPVVPLGVSEPVRLTEEVTFGTPERRKRITNVKPVHPSSVTFEGHAERTDPIRREILVELRARVRALGPDVTERVTAAKRIAYSRSRVFLEVKIHRDRIRILFLDFPLDDPRGVVKRIPETHGWGRLRNLVNLRSLADLDYVMQFVAGSYQFGRS